MDIEKFAIRAAKGNNGGEWATHYTDAQKDYWRQYVRDLVDEIQPVLGVIRKIVHTPTKRTAFKNAADHFQSDFDQIRKLTGGESDV